MTNADRHKTETLLDRYGLRIAARSRVWVCSPPPDSSRLMISS